MPAKPRFLRTIRVAAAPAGRRRGRLTAGSLAFPCALGRTGLSRRKREGDGATPVARLRPLAVLYRPDRGPRPRTALPVRAIRRADGWCDDPADRNYNRRVAIPYPASHEELARADGLYDLVVVLDWNTRPRMPGRGSAIFVHVARPDSAPTAGCVALEAQALRRLLARLGPRSILSIDDASARRRPRAEDRAADPHMRRAKRDRRGKVPAHPH